MKFRIVLIFCLLFSIVAFAQDIHESVSPVVSDPASLISSEDVSKREKREATAPVSLVFASGERLRGRIILYGESLTIPAKENVLGRSIALPYSNISEIAVLSWQVHEKGKNEYYFSPDSVSITMKNGEIYRGAKIMGKIDFIASNGSRNTFFTCFYDYRKNGKWEHSGQIEKDYPTQNPHPKTVVSIIFDG